MTGVQRARAASKAAVHRWLALWLLVLIVALVAQALT